MASRKVKYSQDCGPVFTNTCGKIENKECCERITDNSKFVDSAMAIKSLVLNENQGCNIIALGFIYLFILNQCCIVHFFLSAV